MDRLTIKPIGTFFAEVSARVDAKLTYEDKLKEFGKQPPAGTVYSEEDAKKIREAYDTTVKQHDLEFAIKEAIGVTK